MHEHVELTLISKIHTAFNFTFRKFAPTSFATNYHKSSSNSTTTTAVISTPMANFNSRSSNQSNSICMANNVRTNRKFVVTLQQSFNISCFVVVELPSAKCYNNKDCIKPSNSQSISFCFIDATHVYRYCTNSTCEYAISTGWRFILTLKSPSKCWVRIFIKFFNLYRMRLKICCRRHPLNRRHYSVPEFLTMDSKSESLFLLFA